MKTPFLPNRYSKFSANPSGGVDLRWIGTTLKSEHTYRVRANVAVGRLGTLTDSCTITFDAPGLPATSAPIQATAANIYSPYEFLWTSSSANPMIHFALGCTNTNVKDLLLDDISITDVAECQAQQVPVAP